MEHKDWVKAIMVNINRILESIGKLLITSRVIYTCSSPMKNPTRYKTGLWARMVIWTLFSHWFWIKTKIKVRLDWTLEICILMFTEVGFLPVSVHHGCFVELPDQQSHLSKVIHELKKENGQWSTTGGGYASASWFICLV